MHGIRESHSSIRHRFLLSEAKNASGWRTFGQRPLLPNIQTSSGGLLMSALCQKQTHAVQQLGLLLDHLVGASEDCRRHCETNRPSRREIDRQLELARLLNRNWPAAAEDRRGGARFFYDGRDGQGFRLVDKVIDHRPEIPPLAVVS